MKSKVSWMVSLKDYVFFKKKPSPSFVPLALLLLQQQISGTSLKNCLLKQYSLIFTVGTAVLSQSHRCQLHHIWLQTFIHHLLSCCFLAVSLGIPVNWQAGWRSSRAPVSEAALCSEILSKWTLQMYKLTSHLSKGLDMSDQLHHCSKAEASWIPWLCPL